MNWLTSFANKAAFSDRFQNRDDRRLLLATGLFGEVGSVLAEVKKMEREGAAYPIYRQRLTEELGDCLWYFVRIVADSDSALLDELPAIAVQDISQSRLALSVNLGADVGKVLQCIQSGGQTELRASMLSVWQGLAAIASKAGIQMDQVAEANLIKTGSRWPVKREFHPLFDDDSPVEEKLPRFLVMEFQEHKRGSRIEVLLRCNGINIGDRITDNISDSDDYRYHDIFHSAYAVFLGWSPVTRSLLRCKRKSRPEIDENQDGARAAILEEAISAIVFSRAKNMKFFEGADQVDYDLLKSIQEFVRGYEVDSVPVWQWEHAILEGYRAFRQLRAGRGGVITWNMPEHTLQYAAPTPGGASSS